MSRWICPTPDTSDGPSDWPDLITLTATVYGEAEGEPDDGKRAVACVIVNRSRDPRWPDAIGSVCLQPMQFSCWNSGSPRLAVMRNPQRYGREEIWTACFRAACAALWGRDDQTSGANHYLNTAVTRQMRGGTLPSWYDAAKVTATIGAHEFLRL